MRTILSQAWRSLVTGFLIFSQQIISSGRAFAQPTLKSAPLPASDAVLGAELIKGSFRRDGEGSDKVGLWAGVGHPEGTLLGEVKNMGDGGAVTLLPALAGETLSS